LASADAAGKQGKRVLIRQKSPDFLPASRAPPQPTLNRAG